MASTNEDIKPVANPFLEAFPPLDPNLKFSRFTQVELEMALIELTVEAAWKSSQKKLKKAKTAAERVRIRRKEMHAVNTASETAEAREAQEFLDGRIRLLEWGTELGEWEEKYWYSRL